jgi:hypothetical protein
MAGCNNPAMLILYFTSCVSNLGYKKAQTKPCNGFDETMYILFGGIICRFTPYIPFLLLSEEYWFNKTKNQHMPGCPSKIPKGTSRDIPTFSRTHEFWISKF